MVLEDKYIGLALAVSSSLAIGTSFIITKKGLNDAAQTSAYATASEDRAYLTNPIWWAGMITLIMGEIANFAAYTFAPPILVTPLGALSVLIGAVLASFLLKEELGHLGRIGCTLCLVGSLIIVLHAPEDKEIQTVDEILNYAIQPGFMLYCFTVLVFALIMIYGVAPKFGKKNPMVYISICSTVGSVSVMAIKGFGVAVKLTLSGNNQLTHPSTYVFGIVVVGCIMVQMNYFNKALDIFSTNVVNPMYYVTFTTATIIASLILFQGFYNTTNGNTVSLISGFIIIFLGVHLLNLSRKSTTLQTPIDGHIPHLPLENGFSNPRLSLDSSWSGQGGGTMSAGHVRRGSFGRANGYTTGGHDHEAVGLSQLREEEETDDGEDADERTGLRSATRRGDLESAGGAR
ncbi:hypothetical protein FRC02_004064 [Tulasnella sp. 418]|nr:hypothetical protein FRC02_004064 [Tulasnella sp. 418]